MPDGRRRDEQAERMYARYCAGLSLADVAAEFSRTRQSVFGLFQGRGWELRSRPQPLPHVEFNGRKYTMRNMGYYGATDGDRGLLHRHVWEFHRGPIPAGHDVHHKDHCRTNNDVQNLELLDKGEHTRRHQLEKATHNT